MYIAVGRLLSLTKLGRLAWVAAYVAGGLLFSIPNLIEATYAQPIILVRWLEPGEKVELSAKFPHPYVEDSATSEGIRLLIRRSQFDPSLVQDPTLDPCPPERITFRSSEWRRAAPVCGFGRLVSAAIAHLSVKHHRAA